MNKNKYLMNHHLITHLASRYDIYGYLKTSNKHNNNFPPLLKIKKIEKCKK